MYFDEETELCYNRFRYYSPDSGTYISQDPIGLEGQMPNMYSYVHDSNSWVDLFGLAPTSPLDRAVLKGLLGDNAKDGGVYMFKEGGKWYVGKSNNLYRRLREHMGKVLPNGNRKLASSALDTLQVIVEKGGKNLFTLEGEVMDAFKEAGEDLANKIKSPGCK